MEDDRLKLHALLQTLLPGFNLYFRPETKLVIKYPCVIYDIRTLDVNHASNQVYTTGTHFKVTIMTRLPGIGNPEVMLQIPFSSYETSFTQNDIVHDVFAVHIK